LSEAYRGLLMTGRFPICFIRLDMPPQMVDVNVHPTKLEVRFQDGGRVYSHLLGTLRTRFLNTDLTAKLQPAAAPAAPQLEPAAPGDANVDRRSATDEFFASARPSPGAATARPSDTSSIPPFRPFDAAAGLQPTSLAAARPTTPASSESPFALPEISGPSPRRFDAPEVPPTSGPTGEQHQVPTSTAHDSPSPPAMQVLDRYLIAELENGVIVIDQHALHERILYEEVREKVLGGAMETQNLLVPEPVDLSAAEAAAVLDAQEMLAQLGVQVEPFGGGTVLISSYPAMLANWNPAELLRTLAEQLTSGGKPPDRRDLLDELLHMISCKAAIKAGDRLSPAEIDELLQRRDLAQDAHHCPHGRPTALVFTRDELDKQFKRT
jgi:DNA mismatch repair protein MutL